MTIKQMAKPYKKIAKLYNELAEACSEASELHCMYCLLFDMSTGKCKINNPCDHGKLNENSVVDLIKVRLGD